MALSMTATHRFSISLSTETPPHTHTVALMLTSADGVALYHCAFLAPQTLHTIQLASLQLPSGKFPSSLRQAPKSQKR